MSTAAVHDFTPAQLQRSLKRSLVTPPARARLFRDMADGAVVAQFFLNFAGFEWKETKFFTLLVGLCGEGDRQLEMYDEDLAEIARVSDRTIRTWRSDYLARAHAARCSLLVINEGPYNPDRQRYERTSYSVPVHVANLLEEAVAAARALPNYKKDRLKALEKAAGDCYDEIPDAPPIRRKRNPKNSLRSPVVQGISNAAKNLEKGQKALVGMPERMRASLLAGQGDDLREMLLTMRNRIEDILSVFPENAEEREVSYMPENSSGMLPWKSEGVTHFRVKQEEDTQKPSAEPVHSPEAHAAWQQLESRLNQPRVQRIEIPLYPPDLPPEETNEVPNLEPPQEGATVDELDSIELQERIAVLIETAGLPDAEAVRLAKLEFGIQRE